MGKEKQKEKQIINGAVAQSVEHLPEEQSVGGSIPPRTTYEQCGLGSYEPKPIGKPR